MISLQYRELVFQKIVQRDHYRTCYSHGGFSIYLTLECGHNKTYSSANAPRFEALCHKCTLRRATDAKNKKVHQEPKLLPFKR